VVVATTVYLTRDRSTMPVGDLPGWKQVFTEDFDRDAPLGSFPGQAYGATWDGYEGIKDTSGEGTYSNERVVSVHDGVLDMHLRTEDGTPLVAAPIPLVNGRWGGQLYTRYSVRFKADRVDGYKTAWLMWPDSNQWAEGEIDFPEGPLDGEMYAANLQVGQPGVFDLKTDGLATYDAWHVATVEWTPEAVTFFLDGKQVATSASSPSTPMHWVLQTETDHARPPADSSGHVLVDWVTVYERR
jgi:beta-glucanase (GH16 family)